MANQLTIPGTYCTMRYTEEPTPAYIHDFTAHKSRHWAAIRAAIDPYIGDQIERHIRECATPKKQVRAPVYRARVQPLIDAEVNRGLAIIAYDPNVVVVGGNYSILNASEFENAMTELLRDFTDLSKRDIRKRAIQCRHWAEACAFELTKALLSGSLR